MNRLKRERQVAAIAALIEGNSVRSTERMTGAHRDTIMRLMVRVGNACEAFMDREMRNLPCEEIQVDEVWGFVAKKHRNIKPGDDETRVGNFWIYTAIDAHSRLVPCYRVGKQNKETTHAFISDLASRMEGRIQLSSDALQHYISAVREGFGTEVDWGKIVRVFSPDKVGRPGRYSPPKVVRVTRKPLIGNPNPDRISTSYCERVHLTARMSMRRMTRLTNAFSKKPENHRAAVALHFASYNYVKKHGTLKTTPAVAAGLSNRIWTVGDLIALAD